jgi:hypothetical protein
MGQVAINIEVVSIAPPKFFHRLAKLNEYEIVHLALVTHGEFELPEYLRGLGSPERIPRGRHGP